MNFNGVFHDFHHPFWWKTLFLVQQCPQKSNYTGAVFMLSPTGPMNFPHVLNRTKSQQPGSSMPHLLQRWSYPPGKPRKCQKLPSLKLKQLLKMDGWNTTFLLGRPIFRGYVSFREGTAGVTFFSQTWNVSCKLVRSEINHLSTGEGFHQIDSMYHEEGSRTFCTCLSKEKHHMQQQLDEFRNRIEHDKQRSWPSDQFRFVDDPSGVKIPSEHRSTNIPVSKLRAEKGICSYNNFSFQRFTIIHHLGVSENNGTPKSSICS